MNRADAPTSATPRTSLATDPRADDRRLRGGTYTTRFDDVWSAALILARTLGGWSMTGSDVKNGEIRADVRGWLWKRPDRAVIRISLDEMGLTRVDVSMTPMGFRLSRRVSARRIGRFQRALETALGRGR